MSGNRVWAYTPPRVQIPNSPRSRDRSRSLRLWVATQSPPRMLPTSEGFFCVSPSILCLICPSVKRDARKNGMPVKGSRLALPRVLPLGQYESCHSRLSTSQRASQGHSVPFPSPVMVSASVGKPFPAGNPCHASVDCREVSRSPVWPKSV